jgi:hypothetical protein
MPQGKFDSYTCTDEMVTPFKMPPGNFFHDADEHRFNSNHSSVRVAAEHTIGILKGRFPFLQQIPLRIDTSNHSVFVCIRYIEACIVLHNILLAGTEVENDVEEYHEEDDETNEQGGEGKKDDDSDDEEDGLVFAVAARNNEKRQFLMRLIKTIATEKITNE